MEQINRDELQSYLGGPVEGVVVKYQSDVNVSKAFRESKSESELQSDGFIERLGDNFATNARFHKAIQHLRDKYIEELDTDFEKEYEELVKTMLWVEYSSIIKRYARTGAKQYYEYVMSL